MLQMTSLELSELVQQQLLENPVLEEVNGQEELQELASEILDQYATSNTNNEEPPRPFESEEAAVLNGSPAADSNTEDYVNGTFGETIAADVVDVSAERETTELSDQTVNTSSAEVTDSSEATATSEDTAANEERDSFDEVDFDREFREYLDPGYKTQERDYDPDAPSFEQFLSRPPSLAEHLLWQLGITIDEGPIREVATCIIGNLDNNGRLVATDEEIASLCRATHEVIEEARRVIMSLEPIGCGSRDVRECLLAQLEAQGEQETIVYNLVRDHLFDLHPNRLPVLAKQTGLSTDELNRHLETIRELDPFPGRRYAANEAIQIVPEIFIEKVDGEYCIYFADEGNPRLRINYTYQQMIKRAETSKETRDFIKEKMRSALDLLRNIEHRRQTIYRVAEAIVNRQKGFLDFGVQYLKPMMLKNIAEDTGLHLSTISRVVNRKYAHTPQGVIELRRFFSEGMLNEDGEEISTRIIKLKIKKMIEAEDAKDPMTDEQIAKILAREGTKLSRRTIAKYRDQLRIPGSRERRLFV